MNRTGTNQPDDLVPPDADAASDSVVGSVSSMPDDSVVIPKTIGKYEILDPLGAGGMASVYRARHLGLDRIDALKVFEGDRPNADLTRFQREGKLQAKIKHPHVVEAYDCGEESGIHYIAMELIQGVTLADYMQGGRLLDEQTAWFLARQIISALRELQTHGVVHRDIKPGNILLCKAPSNVPQSEETPWVKLADFGVGAAGVKPDNSNSADALKTQAQGFVGTVIYAAPEQFLPGSVDFRSDIYSLGIVIREMLTGDVPEGEVKQIVMERLANYQFDLNLVSKIASEDTVFLLEWMLNSDLNSRPGSYDELLYELDDRELGRGFITLEAPWGMVPSQSNTLTDERMDSHAQTVQMDSSAGIHDRPTLSQIEARGEPVPWTTRLRGQLTISTRLKYGVGIFLPCYVLFLFFILQKSGSIAFDPASSSVISVLQRNPLQHGQIIEGVWKKRELPELASMVTLTGQTGLMRFNSNEILGEETDLNTFSWLVSFRIKSGAGIGFYIDNDPSGNSTSRYFIRAYPDALDVSRSDSNLKECIGALREAPGTSPRLDTIGNFSGVLVDDLHEIKMTRAGNRWIIELNGNELVEFPSLHGNQTGHALLDIAALMGAEVDIFELQLIQY